MDCVGNFKTMKLGLTLISLFLSILAPSVDAFEWPSLTYLPKEKCGRNETYDISMMRCEKCRDPLAHPSINGT